MHSNTNTQFESKVLWPEGMNQRKPAKAPASCNLSHDQIQPNLGQILSNLNPTPLKFCQIQIQFLSNPVKSKSGFGFGIGWSWIWCIPSEY